MLTKSEQPIVTLDMTVRRYKDDDLESVVTLFTEAVRHVSIQDYSPVQVAAWAPSRPTLLIGASE
jgi:hypothetical protein